MQLGDKIELVKQPPKKTDILPEDIPLEILYEDNDIIVVNKPKGMVVHPANRKSKWNSCECNYEYLQKYTFWNWWRD